MGHVVSEGRFSLAFRAVRLQDGAVGKLSPLSSTIPRVASLMAEYFKNN
jgi:hypothetical protein